MFIPGFPLDSYLDLSFSYAEEEYPLDRIDPIEILR